MLYEHPLFGLHTYSRLRKQRFITNVKCAHLENKYLTQTCNTNPYKMNIFINIVSWTEAVEFKS